MLLNVYSVYDSKAQAYLQPFQATNAAIATRMIMDALQQKDHMFHQHAADFTLQEIATFDDTTGIYNAHDAFINLGCLLTYIAPKLEGVA
jgi:hypothetical protein